MIKIDDFEAVIFDLDGTLIDSMGMWKEIDEEYLGGLGIEVPERIQRDLEGLSYHETAVYFKKRFNLKDDLDTIKSDWHRMSHDKYVYELQFKEGAAEFLADLNDRGIKCGIASSNSRQLIEETLLRRGLMKYIQAISTCDDVGKNKPEPDVYLHAAKLLGASPEKCLVFEDVPMGITAGKNAGMRTAAIYDEYSKEVENEKKELADHYLISFKERFYE